MKRKPLISVIVAVYNVEPYVQECLDSLALQTLEDIEIILINDGSTDASGNICDNYAAKDDRFIVIHQDNCGLSNARNKGLKLASGEYIMFADPDDFVDKDFCRIPYELSIESGADIVYFQHRFIRKEKITVSEFYRTEEGIISSSDAIDIVQKHHTLYVWNKLYRKKLFDDIAFPDGYMFEDIAVTCKLLHSANMVYYTYAVLYNYRANREGSITQERSYRTICEYLEMHDRMWSDLDSWEINYEVKNFELLQSLRYLTYFGYESEYSNACYAIVNRFDPKTHKLNFLSSFLLYLCKNNHGLFDIICMISGKRNHPEEFPNYKY